MRARLNDGTGLGSAEVIGEAIKVIPDVIAAKLAKAINQYLHDAQDLKDISEWKTIHSKPFRQISRPLVLEDHYRWIGKQSDIKKMVFNMVGERLRRKVVGCKGL